MNELYSECCGAPPNENFSCEPDRFNQNKPLGICRDCGEHCYFETEEELENEPTI